MKLLSVTDIAKDLDLSQNRIRQLIRVGRLPAQKIGREYAVLESDYIAFKAKKRPQGRPRSD